MSSYKGLIIKIQKLKASIDRDIENIKKYGFYNPECDKDEYIRIQQEFSDELDNLLISEEYSMKKHFKY